MRTIEKKRVKCTGRPNLIVVMSVVAGYECDMVHSFAPGDSLCRLLTVRASFKCAITFDSESLGLSAEYDTSRNIDVLAVQKR